MTKISVVIPTYNRADTLMNRALPSVFAQDITAELEILVVGDGTDFETVSLMRDLESRDPRVRFWNRPHQDYPDDPGERWCVLGLEARNWGHDHATGEYIAGLDDDDEWRVHMLSTLWKALKQGGVDVAYGRSIAYNSEGKQIAQYGRVPPMHFAFCDGAWLSKHDLGFRYDKACIDRGLPEDGDRIDRMVAAGLKFAFVNDVVHNYYPNPRGMSL